MTYVPSTPQAGPPYAKGVSTPQLPCSHVAAALMWQAPSSSQQPVAAALMWQAPVSGQYHLRASGMPGGMALPVR